MTLPSSAGHDVQLGPREQSRTSWKHTRVHETTPAKSGSHPPPRRPTKRPGVTLPRPAGLGLERTAQARQSPQAPLPARRQEAGCAAWGDSPRARLEGRSEGAPKIATLPCASHHRPSSVAVPHGRRVRPESLPLVPEFHRGGQTVAVGRLTLRPHGNRDGGASRRERQQRLVGTLQPSSTRPIPLHIPSGLARADVRRAAGRAQNSVSYATDFVWDSLLPSAPLIADPPPRAPPGEGD